ncbi:HlyC/CorC family transporter [Saccharophagus sp. K07]|jgi:putative hemolysin|uniref:hemolysin family protein n=1 Tax=Saccharophagus sp. K07 TaxID=2283636 RepID=UPI00165252A0|nr:hemolysin family protein [Saccharophagus sp. K07]MBC6906643.1 HlyC/CorC family transporter [Saccharophagus sp. K07]
MEVLILIGLILLNGVFAMSEIAIVTARKSRLETLAHKGNRGARAALKLAEDPTQFLSTVQIGITSIGLLNGIFGESVLAGPFAVWLQNQGMTPEAASITSTALVVIVVTYVSIVVGELVPKRIGQVSAEIIACVVARPMAVLAQITKPFVMMLSSSTHWLMRIFRLDRVAGQTVTQEDIQAILAEGSTSGVIEQHEHTLVKNVLRLDERSIASLMVPRSDIIYLDITVPLEENYQRVMDSPHSRFPICDRQMDNILGVINAKELLALSIKGNQVDLASLAKPAHFVLETLTGMELLNYFRNSSTQMAFVVDEYGDLKGLITLQDLLEALTGEFYSEDSTDSYIVTRDDGSYLLDGLLPVVDLKDCLQLEHLPDEGEYETLNGMIMQIMGKVPSTGDKVTVDNWLMEIVDMDGLRVDKVLAIQMADGGKVHDEFDDG